MDLASFKRLAVYNRWANRRLLAAAADLPPDALWRDAKAFFGSLMGTLNHLLVTDRIWMARFRQEAMPAYRLDSVLHRELDVFAQARATEDEGIIAYLAGLTAADLFRPLAYRTMAGDPREDPLALLLQHLFNHHAHHRGQAHAILSRLGAKPPSLDLLYFTRETGSNR